MLNKENERLKEELARLRTNMKKSMPETEAIKQLNIEIESLNKEKNLWRTKYKDLEAKAMRDSVQLRECTCATGENHILIYESRMLFYAF